jgi:hypothetical protein
MQKRSGHFLEIPAAKIDIFPREESNFPGRCRSRASCSIIRDVLRVNHYSTRTEEAYIGWTRRYIIYHGEGHPWRNCRRGSRRILTFRSSD